MRIVNLDEFLRMPAGTLFSKYAPCYMEGLQIKIQNIGDRDFVTQEMMMPVKSQDSSEMTSLLHQAQATGSSVPLDFFEWTSRDGCFVEDQLFAVWERQDVAALIGRLTLALAGA